MNTTELNLLAREIGTHLNDVVSNVETSENCPKLHLKSGGYFYFRADYRTNKISVFGNFHVDTKQSDGKTRSEYYGDRLYTADNHSRIATPSISFNADKGAAKCAADIRRRFLTDYVNLYALAVKSAAGHSEYADKTVQTKINIAKACGTHGVDTLRPGNEINFTVGELYLGFRISDNRAEVKINSYLPEEKVLKLIEFLKAL